MTHLQISTTEWYLRNANGAVGLIRSTTTRDYFNSLSKVGPRLDGLKHITVTELSRNLPESRYNG